MSVTPEAVRAALKAATPGPWEKDMSYQWPSKVRSLHEAHRHRWVVDVSSFPDKTHTLADARLIAMAPDLATAYLAQVAEIERLRNALEPFSIVAGVLFGMNYNAGDTVLDIKAKHGEVSLFFEAFIDARRAYRVTEERDHE